MKALPLQLPPVGQAWHEWAALLGSTTYSLSAHATQNHVLLTLSSDCLAPPGPWIKLVLDLDRETSQDQMLDDPATQPPPERPQDTTHDPLTTPHKEQLSWHHFIPHNGRIYTPFMT